MRPTLPLLLLVTSACLGRSESPSFTETIGVDLSHGSFRATRWNDARGWLQLNSDTPPDASWIETSHLVGYFPLDGTFDDATGNGSAVAHANPSFNDDGLAGTGLVLNDAWVEIPHDPSFASSDLTVSLWVKPYRFEGTLFSKDGEGDESSNMEVRLDSTYNQFVVDLETPAASTLQSLSDEAQPFRWYHLIVGWGQSGTRLVLDGELIAESATVTDPTVNDWPFLVGATGHNSLVGNPTADDFFAGEVDEISIWSRAITLAEARDIYNRGKPHHGVYTSEVHDAGYPITWSSMAWQPNRPAEKELTVGGERGYGAGQLSTDGIVALFHLNERAPGSGPGGTDVADAAGSHHGVVVGAELGTPGLLREAPAFDGDNDLIDLGPLDARGTGLTLAAWVYPTGWTNDDARIIVKSIDEVGSSHTWMLSTVGPEHLLRARLKIDGVTETFYTDTAHLIANEWAHVALTYDGTQACVYRNGRLRQQEILVGNLAIEPTVHAAIGANPDGSHSWLGTIDEVSIWERALSPDEIAQLFNRAGLRTRLRVRFCARRDCTGDFVGPDGTAATFYSELLTPGPDLPRVELVPVTARYLQVRIELESDDSSFSPELLAVEIDGR